MTMLIKSLNKSMHPQQQDKSRSRFVNGLDSHTVSSSGFWEQLWHRFQNLSNAALRSSSDEQLGWVPYCNSTRNMDFINNFRSLEYPSLLLQGVRINIFRNSLG